MATPQLLCVTILFSQVSVLLCLDDQERISTSHHRWSNQLAGSLYQQVPSRSAIEAMVVCSNDEKCASFDYDPGANTTNLYYTKLNGGQYQVNGRECPNFEGFHLAKNLSVCYWKTSKALPWEGSRKECQNKGGDLISLDTDEKFMYMRETIGDEDSPYWLGAYKEGTEWAWLSGVPIPLNSKYWHSGQPDGQGGNEKNLISGGDYFEGFGLDDGFDGMHCHALCEITMT